MRRARVVAAAGETAAISVLIAESVPIFREGLESCLEKTPDIRVSGRAGSGSDLRAILVPGRTGVMLLDSSLSGLSGFALLQEIRHQCPAMPVLLMAATADVGWLLRGIRAGAAGVLPKEAPLDEVALAIRRVHAGNAYIGEPLAAKLILFYQRNEREPLDERLSPREFEVMQLLSAGLKLSDIARRLELSHQTVTTHRRHILEKTGLRTTAEIIRYGIINGLCEPESAVARASEAQV